MLDIRGVTKKFFAHTVDERTALNDLSLRLADGDFVTVIGSNGAGKSTLLNVIAGVYRPDAGSIWIDGKDVTKLADFAVARYVGRVFQDPMKGTAPQLTIEENLSLALGRGRARSLGRSLTRAKRERFRRELATLDQGLEDRLKTTVGLLSGGQRQALSLLMAAASQPRILLLDEHTAALDPTRAELITRLTSDVVERHHLTTIMVTHNMELALRLGNRLIMMHDGGIVFELEGEAKRRATVEGLLEQFEKTKGASMSDRSLLN